MKPLPLFLPRLVQQETSRTTTLVYNRAKGQAQMAPNMLQGKALPVGVFFGFVLGFPLVLLLVCFVARLYRQPRRSQGLPGIHSGHASLPPRKVETVSVCSYSSADGRTHQYFLRAPSPAPSSPRPPDIGMPIGYPPPLPPKEVKTASQNSNHSSSKYPRSWVTNSPRSSISPLTLDTAHLHISPRMDADNQSYWKSETIAHWASETTTNIFSRRGSWPPRSSFPRTSTLTRHLSSPREVNVSVRWPFLGNVRSDLRTASFLLGSESADHPVWDDWTDEGRPRTALGSGSKDYGLQRYLADPGPRAPRPCDHYNGTELTASSMQLKASSARPVEASSSKQRAAH